MKVCQQTYPNVLKKTPLSRNTKVSFGRALHPEEIPVYRQTVQDGFDYLGIKNISLILPQPAFPSKEGSDVGVGSPYNSGAKNLIKDLCNWGFNSIQYLPGGKLNNGSAVPYTSSAFSSNDLFIDLEALTTEHWGNILDRHIFDDIVRNKPQSEEFYLPESYGPDQQKVIKHVLTGDNISYYNYLSEKSDYALREAYRNFRNKLFSQEPPQAIKDINNEFSAFCSNPKNSYWLESDAIYQALSRFYGPDFYEKWGKHNLPENTGIEIKPDPLTDKHLFDRSVISKEKAAKRLRAIHNDKAMSFEIGLFKFKQFILSQQNEGFQAYCRNVAEELAKQMGDPKLADKIEMKTIGDVQASVGNRDVWGHPEVFLKGYKVNCPPDIYWGFPGLDFKKLGDIKDQLKEAGQFLYLKFAKVFRENTGGSRVDYAPSVIDPWIAPEGKKANDEKACRLLSSPNHPDLASYSILKPENINEDRHPSEYDHYRHHDDDPGHMTSQQIDEYSKGVNIIVKAAKDNDVNKDQIIFEELDGSSPVPAKVVDQNGLSRIRLTRWGFHYFNNQDWAMIGNHDLESLKEFTDTTFNNPEDLKRHVDYMATDLHLTKQEAKKAGKDKKEFMKYQFVELLSSPVRSIQVFFPDLFGSDEYYNRANMPDPKNWKARIRKDYKQQYTDALINNKGLNFPEAIKLAIEHKKDTKPVPAGLLEKLEKFKNILKEPE